MRFMTLEIYHDLPIAVDVRPWWAKERFVSLVRTFSSIVQSQTASTETNAYW